MLLAESEKAKALRSAILDIVIATINEKTGGGTKYINRRDVNYIPVAITEVYHVAASNIDQDLLHRIMACFMDGSDYDEELKIDIANAMSKGKLGVRGEDYE